MITFGLENEIGIDRDNESQLDVVAESIDLVRQAKDFGAFMRWDYHFEDPHRDMRGFRVDSLRQDTDEAYYLDQDTRRELSFSEIKSDIALTNGGRFYNDHAHPEYCTPECRTIDQLNVYDRAGELMLMECAARLSHIKGAQVRLYKNNTDFLGHSYGCHENYLMARDLPWDRLCEDLEAFLITRQIIAGAGKFATEKEDQWVDGRFQISQRSDFFTVRQSVDTMQRRPIINTRDEPHANPNKYRRFHVILGDANMSPFATRLKVGSTALVLMASQLAWEKSLTQPGIQLKNPVQTLKSISKDVALSQTYSTTKGAQVSALDVQFQYLDWVKSYLEAMPEGWVGVWEDWAATLDELRSGAWDQLAGKLDWVAKRALIQGFQESEGLSASDPWLQSLDLEYHRLDLDEGLYFGLESSGQMQGLPDPAACEKAMRQPPEGVRSWVRGRLIERFGSEIAWAQWDHLLFKADSGLVRVDLTDLFAESDIQRYRYVIEKATQLADLKEIYTELGAR